MSIKLEWGRWGCRLGSVVWRELERWATGMLTINSDVVVKGRLVVAGPVVLDMWFEGDIICSHLEVRPNGYLQGSVAAHDVVVHGQIVGPVHASSIHLKGGCFMEGDIHYTKLVIDPGATVMGRSSRFPVIQMPAELLQLEAKQSNEREALERAAKDTIESDPLWAAVNASKSLGSLKTNGDADVPPLSAAPRLET